MYLLITAVFVVGAFAIARTATAIPQSPWLPHVRASRQVGLKRPIGTR